MISCLQYMQILIPDFFGLIFHRFFSFSRLKPFTKMSPVANDLPSWKRELKVCKNNLSEIIKKFEESSTKRSHTNEKGVVQHHKHRHLSTSPYRPKAETLSSSRSPMQKRPLSEDRRNRYQPTSSTSADAIAHPSVRRESARNGVQVTGGAVSSENSDKTQSSAPFKRRQPLSPSSPPPSSSEYCSSPSERSRSCTSPTTAEESSETETDPCPGSPAAALVEEQTAPTKENSNLFPRRGAAKEERRLRDSDRGRSSFVQANPKLRSWPVHRIPNGNKIGNDHGEQLDRREENLFRPSRSSHARKTPSSTSPLQDVADEEGLRKRSCLNSRRRGEGGGAGRNNCSSSVDGNLNVGDHHHRVIQHQQSQSRSRADPVYENITHPEPIYANVDDGEECEKIERPVAADKEQKQTTVKEVDDKKLSAFREADKNGYNKSSPYRSSSASIQSSSTASATTSTSVKSATAPASDDYVDVNDTLADESETEEEERSRAVNNTVRARAKVSSVNAEANAIKKFRPLAKIRNGHALLAEQIFATAADHCPDPISDSGSSDRSNVTDTATADKVNSKSKRRTYKAGLISPLNKSTMGEESKFAAAAGSDESETGTHRAKIAEIIFSDQGAEEDDQEDQSNNSSNINSLESDSSEEIHYGPGFVSKLKSRYLSVAMRNGGGGGMGGLRRTTSLEDFLDLDKDKDEEQIELRKASYVKNTNNITSTNKYNRRTSVPASMTPSALAASAASGDRDHESRPTSRRFAAKGGVANQVNKRSRESVKRCQSVEVLSRNQLPDDKPPPLPPKNGVTLQPPHHPLNNVLNSEALANDNIELTENEDPNKKSRAMTSTSSSSSSTVIASLRRPGPFHKRNSAALHFGMEERELPAPDTVKQTVKIFETKTTTGPSSGGRGFKIALTKARSTSSLLQGPGSGRQSRSPSRGRKQSVDSAIAPPAKALTTSSATTRRASSPTKSSPTPPSPSPALTPSSKPVLPTKPLISSNNTSPIGTLTKKTTPPANINVNNNNNNASSNNKSGSSNVNNAVAVRKTSSNTFEVPALRHVAKKTSPPPISKSGNKVTDEVILSNDTITKSKNDNNIMISGPDWKAKPSTAIEVEDGIKIVSQDSIDRIRQGGSSISIDFSENKTKNTKPYLPKSAPAVTPTATATNKLNNITNTKSKNNVVSNGVASSTAPVPKQVGVIKPIARSSSPPPLPSSGPPPLAPRTASTTTPTTPAPNVNIKNNKTNGTTTASTTQMAVPKKEVLVIDNTELSTPTPPPPVAPARVNNKNKSNALNGFSNVTNGVGIGKNNSDTKVVALNNRKNSKGVTFAPVLEQHHQLISHQDINDDGIIVDDDVEDKQNGKAADPKNGVGYRDSWKKRQEAEQKNTMVFNFVNSEDVVPHIENDGLDLSKRKKKQHLQHMAKVSAGKLIVTD